MLRDAGVPVPNGDVAATPDDAARILGELGGKAVIKAQVHAGGRGKAGGVKVVSSAEEAREVTARLIGSNLVTHQTGPEGAPVHQVLVEETINVATEMFLAILVDRAVGGPVVIASEAGGMEIEEVAESTPEKIIQEVVDPALGLFPFQGRRLAYGMGIDPKLVGAASSMFVKLFELFQATDCSMLEINPLVITDDGRLLCVDAKITLEDDALFRHASLYELRDRDQEDPLEAEATEYQVQYIRLDGNVGCLVNGAGLAMATMDTALMAGAAPANFLDVGGSADETKVSNAIKLILKDPSVEAILINIFGGILRCDIVARGVIQADQEFGVKVPLVARMLGTNAEEGRRILTESDLNVSFADTLADAADRVREVATR
ncbi:MAG: succinyl-CoA synthetase beta subunit [Chloroflexi bacterium]|nr:MAG: succinyl-CoA synthetase beta subunit [Chloroflexota bacterium]